MDVEEKRPRRHPAGDVPGHPGTSTSYPSRVSDDDSTPNDLVSHNITLEAHELFSQLCGCVNLVKVGPRRGLFLSCVSVGEGVMRIWREWLAEIARRTSASFRGDLGEPASKMQPNGDARSGDRTDTSEQQMLWLDNGRNVGIKVVVKERKWRRDQPILISRDEDVAVSYSIGFEGQQAPSIKDVSLTAGLLQSYKSVPRTFSWPSSSHLSSKLIIPGKP